MGGTGRLEGRTKIEASSAFLTLSPAMEMVPLGVTASPPQFLGLPVKIFLLSPDLCSAEHPSPIYHYSSTTSSLVPLVRGGKQLLSLFAYLCVASPSHLLLQFFQTRCI